MWLSGQIEALRCERVGKGRQVTEAHGRPVGVLCQREEKHMCKSVHITPATAT